MAATKKVTLSSDEIFMLIELVRKNPPIWNSRDLNYYKKEHRLEALNSIAAVIKLSPEDVEAQWRSLRSSFGRELRKNAEQNERGVYKRKWRFFKRLEFLRDTIQPRKSLNVSRKPVKPRRKPLQDFQLTSGPLSPLDNSQPESLQLDVDPNSIQQYEIDQKPLLHALVAEEIDQEEDPEKFVSTSPRREPRDRSPLTPSKRRPEALSVVSRSTPVSSNNNNNLTLADAPSTSRRNKRDKDDALDVFSLAASQLCAAKKPDSVASTFGHWVGTVLNELPRRAQLDAMQKINVILFDVQNNQL